MFKNLLYYKIYQKMYTITLYDLLMFKLYLEFFKES